MSSNPYETMRSLFGTPGLIAYAKCHNDLNLFCEIMLKGTWDASELGSFGKRVMQHGAAQNINLLLRAQLDKLRREHTKLEEVTRQFL